MNGDNLPPTTTESLLAASPGTEPNIPTVALSASGVNGLALLLPISPAMPDSDRPLLTRNVLDGFTPLRNAKTSPVVPHPVSFSEPTSSRHDSTASTNLEKGSLAELRAWRAQRRAPASQPSPPPSAEIAHVEGTIAEGETPILRSHSHMTMGRSNSSEH